MNACVRALLAQKGTEKIYLSSIVPGSDGEIFGNRIAFNNMYTMKAHCNVLTILVEPHILLPGARVPPDLVTLVSTPVHLEFLEYCEKKRIYTRVRDTVEIALDKPVRDTS